MTLNYHFHKTFQRLNSICLIVVLICVFGFLSARPAQAQHATVSDVIKNLSTKERDALATGMAHRMAPALVDDANRQTVRDLAKNTGKDTGADTDQSTPFAPQKESARDKAVAGEAKRLSEKDLQAGRTVMTAGTKEFVKQVEKAFPDPNSAARKFLDDIKKDEGKGKLYRKFAKAMLDADPKKVEEVFRQKRDEYLKEKYEAYVKEGTDYYKGFFNSVFPGGRLAKMAGTTPADVALATAKAAAKELNRAIDRETEFAVDCFHRTYRHEKGAGPGQAKDLVFNSNYDCVQAQKVDDGLSDSRSDDMTSFRRDAGEFLRRMSQKGKQWDRAFGRLGMTRDEMIALADEYDEAVARGEISGSETPSEGFQEFARSAAVKKRAEKLKSRKKRREQQTSYPVDDNLEHWVAQNREKSIKEKIFDRVKLVTLPVRDAFVYYKPKAVDDFLRWAASVFAGSIVDVLRAQLSNDRFKELTKLPEDGLPSEDYLPEYTKENIAAKMAVESTAEAEREEAARKAQEGKFEKKEAKADPKDVPESCQRDPDAPDEMKDENGCLAFGAPTKELSYIHTPPNDEAPKQERVDPCSAFSNRLAAARDRYDEGEIEVASDAIEQVLSDLDALPNHDTCMEARDRSETNLKKIQRVIELISDITDSLKNCRPDSIDHHVKFLDGTKNKRLRRILRQLRRARPVAENYTKAKDAYWNGNIDRSESLFRRALRLSRSSETCTNIEERIGNNLKRIDRLKDFDRATTAAISACNMTHVANLMKTLGGSTNPYLDKAYARLENIPSRCEQKNADSACVRSYGANVVGVVQQGDGDGNTISCECKSGFEWTTSEGTNKSRCISVALSQQRKKDARNSYCRDKYGSGYYSGRVRKDGTYYCLPTKAVANRWCNANNKGSGWYSGKINSKGGYNCYKNTARRSKSRRRRNTASRPRARTPRGSRTRPRRVRQQQTYDPRAAAAAAAIILQGVQAYQRSRRGRRGGGGGGCANPRAPGC